MGDSIAPGERDGPERDFRPEFGAVGQSGRKQSFQSAQLDSVQIQPAGGCTTGHMVLERPCSGATSAAIRRVSLGQVPNGDAPETELRH